MSDIQDEAYSEAMDEISRLKDERNRMSEQAIAFRNMAQRQGFYLLRAVDILESVRNGLDFVDKNIWEAYGVTQKFLDELRKMAK